MSTVYPLFLAGEWVKTDTVLPNVNPYSGEKIGDVCQAGEEEAERAVEAAVRSFPELRRLPSYERARILLDVAAQIRENKEELVTLMSSEAGVPRFFTGIEVDRAVHTFTTAAEEAKRIGGEVLPLDLLPGSENRFGYTRRVPIGPILGITPFNFPLNLVAHKVAPAFAVGNPVVLKPAPQAPCTALKLAEFFEKAGLPRGALSVLPTSVKVAEKLVRDERFKLLTFTGSASVGWYLKQVAGKKRVMLELGSNSAAVVHEDTPDLDFAAKRLALGGLASAGQVCISVQRVFVHRPVYDTFRQRFLEAVAEIPVGDPLDPATRVGPLIDEANAIRVEKWVENAVAKGARVLTGGHRNGVFYEPTVLENVDHTCEVYTEEIFGPVILLEPYETFEDALDLVNESRFGLQAGVFTSNIRNILQAADELEVGGVIINDYPTYRIDHMPYGGVKESGLGREGLKYAIQEMTELRLVVFNR